MTHCAIHAKFGRKGIPVKLDLKIIIFHISMQKIRVERNSHSQTGKSGTTYPRFYGEIVNGRGIFDIQLPTKTVPTMFGRSCAKLGYEF